MPKLRYAHACDVEAMAKDIVEKLDMKWIRLEHVRFIRSTGSKSSATARIYGLPKSFQVAFNLPPLYVIEVISEKFDVLPAEKQVEVLVHELLHIPKSFSGGLRPHGKAVNSRVVRRLTEKYLSTLARR
ncbi:putative metallopeptidase [Infirmifilum sp. SLHALR2]|nr:MAG: hypothetical protein B7L53_04405 [Thermofilum sp. NZ13]